ncbi:MAG: diguanylate cyclase [Ktedonobacteraceae bacterium]|nr:diguanylate cyclase [Ktedonobacteraceae bacterium]
MMNKIKAAFRGSRSWLAHGLHSPLLSSGPLAWVLITLAVLPLFIPYFVIPGSTNTSLGGFLALSTLSTAVGAFLRARKGSLFAQGVFLLGTTLSSLHTFGLAWPQVEIATWGIGCIGGCIFALVIGQFSFMSKALAAALAAIRKQALTDGLTGLPNHKAIVEQLAHELERAQRFGRPFSVVFFDGDRFKRVNDTYGHAAGDAVLRALGERVSSVLHGGDTVGRYGGEEFVVVLPEADRTQAYAMAERMRASVATGPVATEVVEGGIPATISIGIAMYPDDAGTADELLIKADEAMYWAKHLGRNQVRTVADAVQAKREAENVEHIYVDERERDESHTTAQKVVQAQRSECMGMIASLLALIQLRDREMREHSTAVSELAATIAEEMGLAETQIFAIAMAGLLHDIGKISLPDALLKKSSSFTPPEVLLVQQHPDLGAQILDTCPSLRELIPAVRHHHERWDGTGYPEHLAGEQPPVEARIIAVAEAYHTMINDHAYQERYSHKNALKELENCAGTQFDPAVIRATTRVLNRHEQQSGAKKMLPTFS